MAPDLLFVAHRVPYPPDKGDRIRTYHLLRHLSRHAAVHLVALADEPVPSEAVEALGSLCKRIKIIRLGCWPRRARAATSLLVGNTVSEGAFASPSVRATLRRWARCTRFHAALASASSVAPYLRLPELRDVPAVVDMVDVDSQKWLDYAATSRGPRSWLYRLEGGRLRRLEQSLPEWARAVVLVSRSEAVLYRRQVGSGAVLAITNGVDLDAFRPSSDVAPQGCVFVGALDYRPNVEGAAWFCREVWPEIRRRCPRVTFRLVGRRPGPAVRRLAGLPGVELIGQVPDVRPYVDGAAVVVAPLQIARGVQNKVLEAMAMGKPVVTSPQALEGLGAKSGLHLLAAATPDAWSDAIARLLNDADQRRKLGAAARRYVEENHRWDRCLEPFATLLGLDDRAADCGAGVR